MFTTICDVNDSWSLVLFCSFLLVMLAGQSVHILNVCHVVFSRIVTIATQVERLSLRGHSTFGSRLSVRHFCCHRSCFLSGLSFGALNVRNALVVILLHEIVAKCDVVEVRIFIWVITLLKVWTCLNITNWLWIVWTYSFGSVSWRLCLAQSLVKLRHFLCLVELYRCIMARLLMIYVRLCVTSWLGFYFWLLRLWYRS